MAKDNDIGRILIYQNEKGDTKIDVFFEEDTIWMSQRNIAELYQTTPQNITLHIKNIYSDGELEENSTCKNYLQVQKEGTKQVKREIKIYQLSFIGNLKDRVIICDAVIKENESGLNDMFQVHHLAGRLPAFFFSNTKRRQRLIALSGGNL